MELKQLSYFLHICETGSFTASANQLFITQQGLSMSISRLEKELGCPLFIRGGHKIRLTPDGVYLREKAIQLLSLTDECISHFDSLYRQNQTIKIVSGIDSIGMLPFHVQKILQNRDSQFSIKLQFAPGIQSEQLLDSGICNIGFICGPINYQKYCAHHIMKRNFSYIVNADNPISSFDSLSIKQFKDQPLIYPGPETKIYHEFFDLCSQNGFKPNIIFNTTNQSLVYNMVKRDATCIGQVIDYFTENLNDPQIKVLPMSDCNALPWHLYLVWRKNHILSQSEKRFVNLVLNAMNLPDRCL